ncbi:hypothetical protein evm_013920 [Chilo suppressalis]|nr:hypothetical protein evm_013920 [Chilo suppressalis]
MLKDKLMIYETIRGKSSKKGVQQRDQQAHSHRVDVHRTRVKSGGMQRCFNCGSKDHVAAECKTGVKCFGCNAFGHIRRDCTVNPVKQGIVSNNNYNHDKMAARVHTTTAVNESGNERRFNQPASATAMFGSIEGNERRFDQLPESTAIFRSIEGIESGTERRFNQPAAAPAISGLTEGNENETGSQDRRQMAAGNLHVNVDRVNRERMNDCMTSAINVNKVNVNKKATKPVKLIKINTFCVNSLVDTGSDVNIICLKLFQLLKMNVLEDNLVVSGLGQCKIKSIDHVRDAAIKDEALKCVQEYQPVQIKEAPIQLRIVLKDDIPVAQRPRRLSLVEQQVVEKQVEEWLEQGIVQLPLN